MPRATMENLKAVPRATMDRPYLNFTSLLSPCSNQAYLLPQMRHQSSHNQLSSLRAARPY